jgi:hypothetical protein
MPLMLRCAVQQSEAQHNAQRVIERLHNLYSSGAVVPLPFLRATDAAPLALLGIDRGPPRMPGPEQVGKGRRSREKALALFGLGCWLTRWAGLEAVGRLGALGRGFPGPRLGTLQHRLFGPSRRRGALLCLLCGSQV